MSRALEFGTIGILVVDVISIVISLSVKYWAYWDNNDNKAYIGLWEGCMKTAQMKIPRCVDWNYDTAYINGFSMGDMRTVQAMVILALICVLGSLAGIVKKRCFVLKDDKKAVLHGEMGLLIMAGLFLMVGMAVFVDTIFGPLEREEFEGATLHVGFAFCIISWVLAWVGAGFAFMTSGFKVAISAQTGNQQTAE